MDIEDFRVNEDEQKLGDVNLSGLSDEVLLRHLDEVSEEIKRRNGLLPQTAGSAAVDIMKALQIAVRPR